MIYELLKKLNMPVAYYKFESKVELPFLIYYENGSNNFLADNYVYDADYNYVIEYYFNTKDTNTEKKIENLFNENEIVWRKGSDAYISSEQIFVIPYYI